MSMYHIVSFLFLLYSTMYMTHINEENVNERQFARHNVDILEGIMKFSQLYLLGIMGQLYRTTALAQTKTNDCAFAAVI